MVGGEGGEPVDGEVVDPDDEDGDVDGEDPEHEDEDGVGVVVKVVGGRGALWEGEDRELAFFLNFHLG